MKQKERLNYLVQYLCKDSIVYGDITVRDEHKRKLMRSLMNIRMPKQVSKEFLKIQNDFLQEESVEKGIIDVDNIHTIKETFNTDFKNSDKISLWQGDITRLKADVIVNAANSRMLGCFVPCHGCIDNAIHSASGIQLREECAKYMKYQQVKFGDDYEEPTGNAMMTLSYNLPSKYIIHTVGPIVNGNPTKKDCILLKKCYTSCLELANKKELKNIVFCCISTGQYGFPNQQAAEIALETIISFLESKNNLQKIIFNVFTNKDFEIYKNIINSIYK